MKTTLLSVLLVLLPVMASADSSGICGANGDNVTWAYVEATNTLTISGSGNMKNYSSSSVMPWSSFKTSILTIIIEKGVTSIGNSAFLGCSGLTSLTIASSVTSIGSSAFSNCNELTEVTCMAKNTPETGNDVFSTITLSNATLLVPNKSLSNYKSSYPWSSFDRISSFDAYISGLYYIFDTPNEEAVIFDHSGNPVGTLNIPSYVVYDGVDYDVVGIYDYAFEGCSGLKSINIPNCLTSIGEDAFSNCTGLTSISISKKIKSIGQSAFKGCSGLTSIIVNSDNTVYDSRNNCNAIIETETGNLIQGCNTTTIPNDVTKIGDFAFYNCSKLTSLTIPISVVSIGSSAFYGCSGLTSVSIPSGVSVIKDDAFYGCNGLESVTIPNSVTSIGNRAFYGCFSMKTLKLRNLRVLSKLSKKQILMFA